jgi:hypothetical protein
LYKVSLPFNAAVGGASAGAAGHLVIGSGLNAGMFGRALEAVGFAGGGTRSFLEAIPSGLLAGVVVVIAVGGSVY